MYFHQLFLFLLPLNYHFLALYNPYCNDKGKKMITAKSYSSYVITIGQIVNWNVCFGS